jgi:hypothetical protein
MTTGCKEDKKETSVTYDKNTTTLINIHGKTDKRLHLYFFMMYRPKYFPDGKVNSECRTVLNPLTATKRGKLKYGGVVVENQDEYNITIPVQNKTLENRCQYTPIGISVRITRLHEKHGLYSEVPIYTDTPIYISAATAGSDSGGWDGKVHYRGIALRKTGKVAEPKNYFKIRDGATVKCFTKHYEEDGRLKETVKFKCKLPYEGNAQWRDEIVDDSIALDIVVDSNKSYYYPTLKKTRSGIKGHSEPFQEEKLNWYDKIKLWVKGE